ncbi:uncharacterized protein LACBIDRAFT_335638 [Laccaria bicolor S238N-H82]|uniref:Predicted protein n=1 Tax=Laccaria bicolor (strain S238N-H82 / ATCC MYA-4686) TaxID=486041 RepID=B0E2X7_LACBS|nr:uncharacterized protein LACBIDRAFT_335638 [Laccaria bicolor S238N-H82]EDQ98807.1 predicted protein [Laccaria bicolor S238N-H82]|eukprot:XP_001890537.1 predicted protein [Laccaria bicolor S238N-H82]
MSTSLIPAHPHLKLKLTNSRELWNFRTATESPHLSMTWAISMAHSYTWNISQIRTYNHLIFYSGIISSNGAGEPTWDYEDALGDGGFDFTSNFEDIHQRCTPPLSVKFVKDLENVRPSRSCLPAEIRLEKHNKTVIPNSERVSHGNPGIPPHWKPEIKHNTLSHTLRPPSIEHVDYNSGGRTLHGNHRIVLQRVLVTPAYWLCMSNCGLLPNGCRAIEWLSHPNQCDSQLEL